MNCFQDLHPGKDGRNITNWCNLFEKTERYLLNPLEANLLGVLANKYSKVLRRGKSLTRFGSCFARSSDPRLQALKESSAFAKATFKVFCFLKQNEAHRDSHLGNNVLRSGKSLTRFGSCFARSCEPGLQALKESSAFAKATFKVFCFLKQNEAHRDSHLQRWQSLRACTTYDAICATKGQIANALWILLCKK